MSEMDLRYRAACGDLIILVNEFDFSARWGWIPIIDLAVSFNDLCHCLAKTTDGVEIFEFTESDSTIKFRRNADTVSISTSYVPYFEEIAFGELEKAIEQFCDKALHETTIRFPSLQENPVFRKLQSQISNSNGGTQGRMR